MLAASEVFAHKGYRDVTIAEISKKAGVNIAAVNYHFKNKETLYRAAWRHSFMESIRNFPPDGGVADDAPPEERLKGYITSLIHRIADKNNMEFPIMQREMANPTGLLEQVIHETIRPLHERAEGIVSELLGPSASREQVLFCAISIISQCTTPILIHRTTIERQGLKSPMPRIKNHKTFARHIVEFSLGGIHALRRGARPPAGKESSKL
jgi:AcrR family transcriptional regulator